MSFSTRDRGSRQAVSGPTPIVVGFGVSTRKHVLDLHAAGADGVVVGSYLVGKTECWTQAAGGKKCQKVSYLSIETSM